jgi:hypothetical protein
VGKESSRERSEERSGNAEGCRMALWHKDRATHHYRIGRPIEFSHTST